MTAETELRRAIQVAATHAGARLFRLNTGMGWTGETKRMGRDVLVRNARPLHAGVGVGGSDLIGWTADGRFLAIEIKTGRVPVTVEQERFLAAIVAAGGVAGVARSVADAEAIIKGEPAGGGQPAGSKVRSKGG